MRNRMVNPDFWVDEDMVGVSAECRLLLIGLWMMADRNGVIPDKPVRIRMTIFPDQGVDVERWIGELIHRGKLRKYQSGGNWYLAVENFAKYQRVHPRERELYPHVPAISDELQAVDEKKPGKGKPGREKVGPGLPFWEERDHLEVEVEVEVEVKEEEGVGEGTEAVGVVDNFGGDGGGEMMDEALVERYLGEAQRTGQIPAMTAVGRERVKADFLGAVRQVRSVYKVTGAELMDVLTLLTTDVGKTEGGDWSGWGSVVKDGRGLVKHWPALVTKARERRKAGKAERQVKAKRAEAVVEDEAVRLARKKVETWDAALESGGVDPKLWGMVKARATELAKDLVPAEEVQELLGKFTGKMGTAK